MAGPLELTEAGTGAPLVLLHAFPLVPDMWAPQVEALSSRWRVVTPFLDFTRHPSMEAMADAVAELVRGLDAGPVVVGGLSMGGYVTMALLGRHPELVRAAVLADTRDGPDSDEVRERRTRQQAQVAAEGTTPVVEAMAEALPGPTTKRERPEVVAHVRELMSRVAPEWVIAALEAMKVRTGSTGVLAASAVPVLVVVGDEDTVSPPGVARDMAAAAPSGRLAVVAGAGHLSNLENPVAFNAELEAFLS